MIAPEPILTGLWIGCDVGSTAVKAVVVDTNSGTILDRRYLRHGTRQADGTARLLRAIGDAQPGLLRRSAICFTGSGGRSLATRLRCRFVQEVNAVALATERRHPAAGSIVDLGGQDAKIIIWQGDRGGRRKFFSMNDKCAGGTGAVIDRIVTKLGLAPDTVGSLRLGSIRTHPVAARCGVFAESDINGLQKQGIPPDELLASLFEAIVHQNLSVLTRGATLLPPVLLLGGPHAFLPGLVDAWRLALGVLWRERKVDLPEDGILDDLVIVPEQACYFAALGAVDDACEAAHATGPAGVGCASAVLEALEEALRSPAELAGEPGLLAGRPPKPRPASPDRPAPREPAGGHDRPAPREPAGSHDGPAPREPAADEDDDIHRWRVQREEIRGLARQESPRGFGHEALRQSIAPRDLDPGSGGRDQVPGGATRDVIIGLDAGSTSTKAVLLDLDGELLAKAYRLSGGDPLADARAILADLEGQAREAGVTLRVRGLGVTGYAKDMLGEFLGADLALVETVAHARSALQIEPEVDVIVDIGGQDIKVLILREGRVRDFRLNSQCSAGNGFFLQSTARRFEIPLEEFADHAFQAERAPRFNVGCAVFLEADIVNFQQIGWQPKEILAGLVRVLPRNVWLYVVGEPNLERLGRRYILQGGTQRNEAAVKAQIDFIHQRVPGAHVRVHPHAGESGAIGAALEILRRGVGEASRFLGFAAVRSMSVRTRQDEATRCHLCPNRCLRTVLEARTRGGDVRTFVVASCERGRTLERSASAATTGPRAASRPDFASQAARVAFRPPPGVVPAGARMRTWADRAPWVPWLRPQARSRQVRQNVRIGFPRALNLTQNASFFMGYLQALGVDRERLLVSGRTTEALFRTGVKRGAVDNCYPTKVAMAHVHDLLFGRELDWLFFPIFVNLPQELDGALGSTVCPSSQAAPEVIKAAFTREGDVFGHRKVRFLSPVFHMGEPALFERQMLRFWGPLLGVTARENRRAMALAGAAAERALEEGLRRSAREEIARLEREGEIGIVALGRPYHDDPGLNHGIFKDLNQRGYSIFSIASLPRDMRFLMRLFGEEIARGRIRNPFDISDVWRHSFSANSNAKVWAAKVVARHANLVALDISSFRCGHDAPIYATVEAILEAAGTPYFTFHDIDENRPSGAIRLRVETIDYSLREYRQRFSREWQPGAPPAVVSSADESLAALSHRGIQ